MRRIIAAAFAISLSVTFATPGFALPPVGFNVAPQESVDSTVEQSRLYCANGYGRFLHWGPCGGYRRVFYRSRVYCRNRWSGRFIHWGPC